MPLDPTSLDPTSLRPHIRQPGAARSGCLASTATPCWTHVPETVSVGKPGAV